MPDKLKEFVRQTIDEILQNASPEEKLKGMSTEERLKGMSTEERLKGLSAEEVVRALSPETLEAIRHLKGNGSSKPN